jgi:hypothetical protein
VLECELLAVGAGVGLGVGVEPGAAGPPAAWQMVPVRSVGQGVGPGVGEGVGLLLDADELFTGGT